MKLWLLTTLANERTYWPLFMGVLSVYAVVGTVATGLALNYFPGYVRLLSCLFVGGAVLLAYCSRMAATLAYAKLNEGSK